MEMEALRVGDILLFEAGDHLLSKAIALLTESSVSHAALLYTQDEIVGMGLHGVSAFRFSVDPSGAPNEDADLIHVRRMNGEPDPAPIIGAAQVYLDQKLVYDMPLLVLLGGLLVYRKLRFTSATWPFVKPILRGAVAALDNWLNERQGRPAQVCSQFVQQCYLDAGYPIRFQNGILQGEQGLCIVDLLQDEPTEASQLTDGSQEDVMLDDAFWTRFNQALSLQTEDDICLFEPPQDALHAAKAFADRAERLSLETATPLKAMFVTPADLLSHASNLYDIGSAWIRRN